MNNAKPKKIRFIDPAYKTLFYVPDGGQILLCWPNGFKETRVCKYLDEYHVMVDTRCFHICEFAELMKKRDVRVVPFPEKRIIWSDKDDCPEEWLAKFGPWYNREDLSPKKYMELAANFLEENEAALPQIRKAFKNCVHAPIVAIIKYDPWQHRKPECRVIESGDLSECFSERGTRTEWYVDRNNDFRCELDTADGQTEILYRVFKLGTSDHDQNDLADSIRLGKDEQSAIDRMTDKLGYIFSKPFEWEFPTDK